MSKIIKPQCAAITTTYGTQCLRRAKTGSKYCWQHLDYKPVKNISNVNPIKTQVEANLQESENLNSISKTNNFSNIISTAYLNNIDGKIDQSENADDYIYSPYADKIVAYGPFIIELPVGRYSPTVIYVSYEFNEKQYTYTQLLDSIRLFYSTPLTIDLLNQLIKLAKNNRDMLSEGLYVGLKTRIKRESLKIYDLNYDSTYFNRIYKEKDRYYLELGN